MKAIAVVSGGVDSVTLAHLLHSQGHSLHLISFDYGQRHVRELEFAALCARRLGSPHHTIDLRSLAPLLKGSALTDNMPVPHGHYTAPSMAATVVPNRNAVMLAIAYSVAVAEEAEMVAAGMHAGDHPIYPDCRPAFVEAFDVMQRLAGEGCTPSDISLHAPFLSSSKTEIVAIGARLGVPFQHTWSCYEGGEVHCGRCGTCVERREAFRDSGVPDPTSYGPE